MQTWTRLFTDGGKKLGRPFTVLRDNLQVKSMEEAGFENITVKNIKVDHTRLFPPFPFYAMIALMNAG